METKDLALVPAEVRAVDPNTKELRLWQGIPGIERALNGRLWATFYSGGKDEGAENFIVLITSDDDGATWSDPLYEVSPPGEIRAYDPCLWHDPMGRLWLFWAQSDKWYDGRCGVWASMCENSQISNPIWSKPQRIANGIMMNKPTVLSNGEWLLPATVWSSRTSSEHDLANERFSNVYVSADQGETFYLRGSADVPNRSIDEHMIIERKDGSLWMLVRTSYGIGESFSYDNGRNWTTGKTSWLGGPDSRFFIRRLLSGNLLLINHHEYANRSHLTAMISKDDGKSWHGFLLLDERSDVSYPDGVQAADGTIYIIYDRERFKAKEILMARFQESDVMQGECMASGSKLKLLVNQAISLS
ncbi:family 43 glycosylhydrolase [Paenibacillus sp. LMG 31461]|uniref:Family 43 glycosylhydrolase n=1 Tax=Paenibacillus plantarum TaxID=2654975 RepID=A0ABX1XC65_9BACL|nr:sialidase family protein [Paenibacillus plantarum]NOU66070.1 family 43 glycosylhydrolase [Paenibacillus plantarum]